MLGSCPASGHSLLLFSLPFTQLTWQRLWFLGRSIMTCQVLRILRLVWGMRDKDNHSTHIRSATRTANSHRYSSPPFLIATLMWVTIFSNFRDFFSAELLIFVLTFQFVRFVILLSCSVVQIFLIFKIPRNFRSWTYYVMLGNTSKVPSWSVPALKKVPAV